MQPTYQPVIIPNNFSEKLLARLAEWEKAQDIKSDEMLTFRAMGTGNTEPLLIKSTARGHENRNFEPMKPVPASHMIPSNVSIPDKDTPGGYVQLQYYEGGYAPGKKIQPIIFKGFDETVINIVPEANPALYNQLVFSPYLKDGPVRSNAGPRFELLRPDAIVEGNLENEEALAEVIVALKKTSYDTLKFIAPKLMMPAETSTEQRMRQNFIDYVKLRPAHVNNVQAQLEADETLIYQQVEDAIEADVVAVDREKQMWVLLNTGQPITPARNDQNTINQLVNFLVLEPGQVTLKQILALTNTPENAAAKSKGGRPKKTA